ncbi:MAG: hypothetical protein J6X48_06265 [Lachnospiraceae bacterium]|nr:hypothetical protein [Lachnospiraceae bacterium]
MACFLVSAAEAVVVTAVEKGVQKKEKVSAHHSEGNHVEEVKIPFSRKLKWLNYMLLGGAVLLAFEHVWHGEVVAWFPFLTAMSNAEDAAEMFKEMGTVGVSMALLITVVWGVMCKVADAIVKRPATDDALKNEA